MRSDTRDQPTSVIPTGAVIELRYGKFVAAFREIGIEDIEAIAREIGMSSRTIRRARAGDMGTSPTFIASTLAALRRGGSGLQFEDLFLVVD